LATRSFVQFWHQYVFKKGREEEAHNNNIDPTDLGLIAPQSVVKDLSVTNEEWMIEYALSADHW
jgi:hypothetical protein